MPQFAAAGEHIHCREPVLRPGVNGNMAFGQDHHARHPAVRGEVVEVAVEHAAEKRIRDIASRRLNMDLDEQGSALHSLETGLLHDALMEAFISGQNTRSA